MGLAGFDERKHYKNIMILEYSKKSYNFNNEIQAHVRPDMKY